MIKELDLTGKTALVTGGGTGLGFGIAQALLDAGAQVVIAGRRAQVLYDACTRLGEHAACRELDLSKTDTLAQFAATCEHDFGSIDILVNNAGMQNNRPALDFKYEDFSAMYDTNLFGPYLLTQAFAKYMLRREKGSIVFITSAASHMGLTNNLAYTGSKGALSAMVRAMASEWSPRGVRVNAVAPGWIETDLVRESLRRVPQRREMVERRTMVPGLGTPRDIGLAVAFLASDAARYITAAELKVDGGMGVSL